MSQKNINKVFSFLGLHPGKFKDYKQRKTRTVIQFFMFVNVIPSIHNMIWKIINEPNISNCSVDIINCIYETAVNLEFFFFVKNFEKIAEILRDIFGNKENVSSIEKRMSTFLMTFFFFMSFANCLEIFKMILMQSNNLSNTYRYVFDPSSHWLLDIFMKILQQISSLCSQTAHLCMHSSYLKICIHFDFLYTDLMSKLGEIDQERSSVKQNKIIKNFVEEHLKIKEKVSTISKILHPILVIEFFLVTLSMTLVLLAGESVQDKLIYIGALAIFLFLFCFPSEILKIQVLLHDEK
jgi:hypothetical protein